MSTVTHLNPPSLHTAAAFSQGTSTGSLVFVGGQNGTDGDGNVLDGLEEQSKQAFRNVLAVLEAAGRRRPPAVTRSLARLTIARTAPASSSHHPRGVLPVGPSSRRTDSGHDSTEHLLARLGPHATGKGCLSTKRLDTVDEDVLEELVGLAASG